MRLTVTLAIALAPGLLGACAAVIRPPSPPAAANPDCSFRAATSCWTPAARFPSRAVEPADTARGTVLDPPAVVLANQVDSTEFDSTEFDSTHLVGRRPWRGRASH